jgi:hypothetical protein
MPFVTGRSAIRLATLILLALVVGGCGGDSASPTAAPTTATTAAPTTTSTPVLGAKEVDWLKGVSAVRTKAVSSGQSRSPSPDLPAQGLRTSHWSTTFR